MLNTTQRAGRLVAEVLRGAWREFPSAENLSAEKVAAVPSLLHSSGSAALGWWRISRVQSPMSNVQGQDAAHRPWTFLHDAYRQSRLAALVHEQEIKHVLSLLRAVDIEPVLVKGWAIARLYPDRALRPYGDIDLCVRPDQLAKAAAALKCLESIEGHYVDLHSGFDRIGRVQSPMSKVQCPSDRVAVTDSSRGLSATGVPGGAAPLGWLSDTPGSSYMNDSDPEGVKQGFDSDSNVPGPSTPRRLRTLDFGPWTRASDDWDELYERSQLVPLGDEQVRVLCPEDHLRLLCMHLLRSGAWRPLWLCDVALLVETRAPDFDWQRCLGDDPLYADWVAVTIGLAHQLLGLYIKDTPVAERAQNLPRWLVPAVLEQWGREHMQGPKSKVQSPKSAIQSSASKVQSQPGAHRLWTLDIGHWTDLYSRWDNPIRATAAVGGRFNNWPRLPYRIAESVMRSRELRVHVRGNRGNRGKGERVNGNAVRPTLITDC